MKCKKRQQSGDIKPNKHQKALETIVENATQMWCSNPIHLRNPLQFLQLSSHCINDVYMEASQVHLEVFDEQRITRNDDDERQFHLSKVNSNRKHKTTVTKDFKRLHANNIERFDRISSNEVSIKSQSIVSKTVAVKTINKSEPPPLAFYPKMRGKTTQQPIIFSATEPPPLVPIASHMKEF